MKIQLLILLFIGAPSLNLLAWDYNGRHGWPDQKPPKSIIICEPGKNLPESMLLESLSGLSALAVNEGSFDEMVWINTDYISYQKIFDQTIAALNIVQIKKMNLWSLVDYLKKKRVINGYILYQKDNPRSNSYASYPDINYSSNVATVYASLLKSVLIDTSLIAKAHKHGLKLVKDARFESPKQCFNINKGKLSNCSALSIPPTVSNLRDYAISQKLMLYADKRELIDEVLEWVKPLSPILGWGCGDEYDFTSTISRWGHYNTATNWCWNLPLISSVSSKVELKKAKEISLGEINFADSTAFHTFVMSDGDNMQWAMGSILDSKSFLGNKEPEKFGLTWTMCPTNLSVISPFTWNALSDLQTKKFSFLEYGGGYQYPDLFALNRPNREELLREFARRINFHLKKLDIKIFGFICCNVASKEAQEAFRIYAEELEDITGMLAVQYFPYELDGGIYWKKNKKGIDIPVVTARYSIWDEVNKERPRAGTPEFVASLINRDATYANSQKEHTLSWTIVHAWSDFSKSSKVTENPAIGFNAVKASANMLINEVHTVSANELLWRIRMKFRPEQTNSFLKH